MSECKGGYCENVGTEHCLHDVSAIEYERSVFVCCKCGEYVDEH